MNLKQQLEAALKAARDIAEKAKSEGRNLTTDEVATFDQKMAEVDDLKAKIKQVEESQERFNRLAALNPAKSEGDDDKPAATLGEHFVKHAGSRLREMKGVSGATASAPEFKAAGDTHTIGGVWGTPVLTEFDRTIVRAYRPRPVIADLLGQGRLGANSNAVTYFVEGAFEGSFATVAEGAAKPQIHVADPTTATDSLRKIAAFLKFTDEMLEDLDFFVTEINNRGLYELARFEEAQILNGNGTGQNLTGLLNRSGVGTQARGNVASGDTVADTIFRAMTQVTTGSGLDPDGIVIHPTDYQALRLAKDGNNQYYGGGFFQGEYGNGGIPTQPPLWGLRTVVTPAITAGTVLVGAFQQAATVYRKGGVRVESTNSHASDFTSNLVTTRIEERVALAVRYPLGIVKTTITPAA